MFAYFLTTTRQSGSLCKKWFNSKTLQISAGHTVLCKQIEIYLWNEECSEYKHYIALELIKEKPLFLPDPEYMDVNILIFLPENLKLTLVDFHND